VSHEERDDEQPWVLAGRCVRHEADEPVEVVADVKFLEQGVQQRTGPIETVCPLCESPEIVDPIVASPVMEPADRLVPSG
jgi:hypothetical protein